MRTARLTAVVLLAMLFGAPAALAAQSAPSEPRPYQPTGTQVEGTPGLLNGPQLLPGQYQDSIQPGEVKNYSIQVDAGTPYLAVTMARGLTSRSSSGDSLEASMFTSGNDLCTSSDRASAPYRGIEPLTAVASTGPVGRDGDSGKCSKPGRYYLSVKRTDDPESDPSPQPLELLYILEPALADATEPSREPEVPLGPVSGTLPIQDTRGSGSFTDAPSLAAGVYRDRIRPGETVFYRVPLGWGQRMQYDVAVGASQAYRSGLSVKSTVFNPYRGELTNESGSLYRDTVTLRSDTPTVDYANREQSSTAAARARLAGYYYIAVHVTPEQDVAVGATELALTLSVNVLGTPRQGPRYADGETVGIPLPANNDGTQPSSQGNPSSALPVMGVGLAVAAVGFGAGAVVLARRYAARAVTERSAR